MAWDSKSSRRRQNSTATSRTSQPSKAPTRIHIEAKSAHVSDPALQPFLHTSFDPATYLNSVLPALQTSSTPAKITTTTTPTTRTTTTNLSTLSSETQTLLSSLSAHTTRLTTTLTQLTDEILRSGSRLAYEVEVLRGETIGLSEALTDGLKDDVVRFVPRGLEDQVATKSATTSLPQRRRLSTIPASKDVQNNGEESASAAVDPPYITQLRTLTLVRTRLDTVIRTFGDAMEWTFPPSEVSVSSSFLSVSAPEPGSSRQHSVEEKGQRVSQTLRDEIAGLLDAEDAVDGIEAAAKRVQELRELAGVWRGTAEEKARGKFVDGLARMVEERHALLMREAEGDGRLRMRVERMEEKAQEEEEEEEEAAESKAQAGFGFLSRLRELRGGP